jgi:nitrogen fixation NifU-like protein
MLVYIRNAFSRRNMNNINNMIRPYGKNVIDHYQSPKNVGSLDSKDINVGTGLVGAPACGDVMRLQINVDADTGIIQDTKFKTFGCGSAIASSSYGSEYIKGKHIDDAYNISNRDIANYLKLPPVKIHCSMLMEDAVKSAINDYKRKSVLRIE